MEGGEPFVDFPEVTQTARGRPGADEGEEDRTGRLGTVKKAGVHSAGAEGAEQAAGETAGPARARPREE